MKPLETEYKSYKFRSRLEARWAVFFDACDVKWEYEPEGFDLGEGLYYLPDFLLHDVLIRDSDLPQDLWVEVKGRMTEQDAKKIIKFANVHCAEDVVDNPILVVTNIPDGDDIWDLMDYMRDLAYEGNDLAFFNLWTIDGDWFGAFPVINKQGRLVIEDDNCRCAGDRDDKATENAYKLARQARFKHKATQIFEASDLLKRYFRRRTNKPNAEHLKLENKKFIENLDAAARLFSEESNDKTRV